MEKSTAKKTLEITKKVRPMIKEWARKSHDAESNGEPTAYVFIGSCYEEILRAMDIVSIGTENYAGLCAAKMVSNKFIEKSQSEGYPSHLCSYATTWLGYDALYKEYGAAPQDSPDGGLARPTVMLGTGMMICDVRYKGYQASQRYTNVPMHVLNLLWPSIDNDPDDVQDYYVKFLVDELRELVRFLEKYTGRKMVWDKLSEVIAITEKTIHIWNECYKLRKSVPAPMPTEDALNIMVPGRFYLGTQLAYDFYSELYSEIKDRVEKKLGVIPEEKYRLLWGGGLPPWFALRMFNYVETLGAVFPIETIYYPPPVIEIPASISDPLERIAYRYYKEKTYRFKKAQKNSGNSDIELILELINDYKIDGVAFHHALTCRTLHVGQRYQVNLLKKFTDIPTVVLESDIADISNFSETQFTENINTFIDIVADFKSRLK